MTRPTQFTAEASAPFWIPHRVTVTSIGEMPLDPPVELKPGWYTFETDQTAAEMERATRLMQEQRAALTKAWGQRDALLTALIALTAVCDPSSSEYVDEPRTIWAQIYLALDKATA
ncbi:hypothetical protein LCGC14_1768930 [marine sediment metagenome]|uniref:Uncharacterized protein n=1 Tax=marine sediment metagenome TaxID=412755 RepID=A0A0F9HLD5_9ZZZZ